jgi:hypothetical protein
VRTSGDRVGFTFRQRGLSGVETQNLRQFFA